MAPSLAYCALPDERQHSFHGRLGRHNATRLSPQFAIDDWTRQLTIEHEFRIEEGHFVESERTAVADLAATAPTTADDFLAWFEALRSSGPGQGDRFFSWIAEYASLAQMRWFLTQEAAGEAGFDDLVALAQIKLPTRPKLEMARNYWDEMGRGHQRAMHGPLLSEVVTSLRLTPAIDATCWQSLALANLMVALAANRRYAYQAVGALGVIEMTAPGRVGLVDAGLERLDAPAPARTYFALHAGLDIKHSKAWNREVLHPLVAADPRTAAPIAEGALMRLNAGARCFDAYRAHFGI